MPPPQALLALIPRQAASPSQHLIQRASGLKRARNLQPHNLVQHPQCAMNCHVLLFRQLSQVAVARQKRRYQRSCQNGCEYVIGRYGAITLGLAFVVFEQLAGSEADARGGF